MFINLELKENAAAKIQQQKIQMTHLGQQQQSIGSVLNRTDSQPIKLTLVGHVTPMQDDGQVLVSR